MVPVLQKGDLPIDNTTSYPAQIYPQQIEDINNTKYLHEHPPKELVPKVFHKRFDSGHEIALNNMGLQSRDKSTHAFQSKDKISSQFSEHGPSRNRLRHEKLFARQSRLPDDSDDDEVYARHSSSSSNDGHSHDGGSDSGPIDFSLFTHNSQGKEDGKKHKNKSQNAPRRQRKFKHLYASSDESDESENSDVAKSATQISRTTNDTSVKSNGQNHAELEQDGNTSSTRPSNSQKRRPGRPRKDDISSVTSKLGDISDSDESVSSRRRERQTTSDSTTSKNKSNATDPNRTDKAGRTRLFSCTGTGNLERVKDLIQKGAYVNWRDNAGWTPLHEAALKGQAEVAKYLLSCGADVNAQGFGNDTPLHDACSNGFSECVQVLVDHDANINLQNSDGQRPIDVCEDDDCIDILNKKQKQIDRLALRDKAGRTSLHRACIAGHFDEAVSLIKSGSDVNAKDNASWTPLHEAALNGHFDIVKSLCDHGAELNPVGYDGSTPLHEASENGHVEVVRYLLEMNADKTIQNKKGQTALQVCDDKSIEELFSTDVKPRHTSPVEETTKRSSSHNSLVTQVEPSDSPPVVKRPLSREEKKIQALMQTFQKMEKRQAKKTKRQHRQHNEDEEEDEEEDDDELANAPSKERESQHRTKRLVRGRPRSASLTQSREASEEAPQPKKPAMKLDPKRKDTAGRTQLHKWAVRGDENIVRELLEAGANSNERDHAGWTPLHEAALRGRLEVLKLLLQHGADPNALGADKDTPLHDAVENGHGDVVSVLLEHGANASARNAANLDCLQIAKDNDDDDMIAILKSAQKLNLVAVSSRQPKTEPISEQDDSTLKLSKSTVSDLAVSVKKMSDHSDSVLETDQGVNGKTVKKRRLVTAAEYHSRSGSQERKKSEEKMNELPHTPKLKAERRLPQALAGGFDIFNISPNPHRKSLPATVKTSTVPKKQLTEGNNEAMDIKKVKKEQEDAPLPSPKKKFWPSLSHAIQYLPLYTVQLQEIGSPKEERALYVVDLQVRLLLGIGNLFEQYPQLERRLITEREKERLWSPLAFMVSEKCAQAVKTSNTGKDKDDFNIKVEKGSATDIARTKEEEKQRFLQTELYFIRLEQTISIIKSDYSHLSNNLITITLDIGYSLNRETPHEKLTYPSTIPSEVAEPTSEPIKPSPAIPSFTDNPTSPSPLPMKRPTYGLPAKFAMKMQKCGLGHKRDVSK